MGVRGERRAPQQCANMVAVMAVTPSTARCLYRSNGHANKGMKQTKSTPWHGCGAAFAAYARRSADR